MALIWPARAPSRACSCCFWLVLIVVWPPISRPTSSAARVGGPQLAPTISPGKTWSGLVGGMLGAALVGVAAAGPDRLGAGCRPRPRSARSWRWWRSSAICSNPALKRRAGVKDSGHSDPRPWRVLDRVDGYLFAAGPAAVALAGSGGHARVRAGRLCHGRGLDLAAAAERRGAAIDHHPRRHRLDRAAARSTWSGRIPSATGSRRWSPAPPRRRAWPRSPVGTAPARGGRRPRGLSGAQARARRQRHRGRGRRRGGASRRPAGPADWVMAGDRRRGRPRARRWRRSGAAAMVALANKECLVCAGSAAHGRGPGRAGRRAAGRFRAQRHLPGDGRRRRSAPSTG